MNKPTATTSPSKPKRSAGVVVCFDVYEYNGVFTRDERYDLYTKDDKFFDRLAKPAAARYYHREYQRSWLKSEYTRRYVIDGQEVYCQFQFDGTEEEYEIIANAIWKKVEINDE